METQNPVHDLGIENIIYEMAHPNLDESLRYGFSMGSLNFIYDLKVPCELVRAVPIYSIPNTPDWMLGLINIRGSLAPVFNLEKYFGFKEEEDKHRLLLVLGKDETAVAFQLKHYPELLGNLTPSETLPKLIPKLDGYIVTAYLQADKVWLELDKENFFSALGEKVCI